MMLRQLRSRNRIREFSPCLAYAIKRIFDLEYAVSERHDAGNSSNDDVFSGRYLFEPLGSRYGSVVKQVNT